LTPDPSANHRWHCALGLPYATGIWQVGDSPQENGAFKYYSRVMKTKIREYYDKQKEIPHIRRYDIVPIVNYAFRRYVLYCCCCGCCCCCSFCFSVNHVVVVLVVLTL